MSYNYNLTMDIFVKQYSQFINSPIFGNNGLKGFILKSGLKITFDVYALSTKAKQLLRGNSNYTKVMKEAIAI